MCNYNEHSYLVIYRPNLQLISTIQEIRLGHNLQSLSITAVTQLADIGETQENCSAVKRSIGSTIGFHNHGEGPY